jgi:hypothetical protein
MRCPFFVSKHFSDCSGLLVLFCHKIQGWMALILFPQMMQRRVYLHLSVYSSTH